MHQTNASTLSHRREALAAKLMRENPVLSPLDAALAADAQLVTILRDETARAALAEGDATIRQHLDAIRAALDAMPADKRHEGARIVARAVERMVGEVAASVAPTARAR